MTPERWKQIKAVLEAALEHSPHTREKFISAACGGDVELRSEVEAYLRFELSDEDDLLEKDAFAAGESVFNNFSSIIGRQIGKYRIVEEIGAGGMGVVFLAERADGEFEQKTAIKFLRQFFAGKSAQKRFRQERRILARLQHRYIAALLDGGTTEDGTPYLIMEYVRGEPITKFAENHQLSFHERLDLFRKICEAVSFAHQNLIVHRDLKPDNILITEEGEPKLLDFGIAKLLSDNEIKATVTRFQALTPEYASPEQISGGDVTTASDVYCLGIILYELLTGEHPFRRAGMTSGQILQALNNSQPARPSSALTSRSNDLKIASQSFAADSKALRGDLDNIILKALSREPERRYASVEQFSQDIKNYLRGFPVSARRDTFFYRAERFIKRNRLASSALLIAFISLLAGLLAAGQQARLANIERARAEQRFSDVRELANSFIFEINEEIEKSPVRARELLVQRALEYLDKLARESGNDPELESELAAAYEKIGDIQSKIFKPMLGKTADALLSHRKALEIREKLSAADPQNIVRGTDVSSSLVKIADLYMMSGEIAAAREHYRRAIDLNTRLLKLDPANREIRRTLGSYTARLGQATLRSGSLRETLDIYNRSLEFFSGLTAEAPEHTGYRRSLGIVYSFTAYVKMEMGSYDEAVELYGKTLEINTRIAAENGGDATNDGHLSSARLWYGVALKNAGRFDESLRNFQKALEIQQRIFSTDRANFGEQNALADCYLELGRFYARTGQAEAAIENLELAIKHYESVWQADPQSFATRRQLAYSRRNLADALRMKNRTEKALVVYQQAQSELSELTAADPQNIEWRHDLAVCHMRLGELLADLNKTEKAREHFLKALPMLETLVAAVPQSVSKRRDLETVKIRLARLSEN